MANSAIMGNSAMATAVEAQQQWLVPQLLTDLKAQQVQRGSTGELLIGWLIEVMNGHEWLLWLIMAHR